MASRRPRIPLTTGPCLAQGPGIDYRIVVKTLKDRSALFQFLCTMVEAGILLSHQRHHTTNPAAILNSSPVMEYDETVTNCCRIGDIQHRDPIVVGRAIVVSIPPHIRCMTDVSSSRFQRRSSHATGS
jgi:hypothetical protein